MPEVSLSPLDDFIPVLAQAVADWKAKHTPEAIAEKTTKLLDEHREEIVYKLLGFNKDHWNGNWELDHCNGRSGESAAGDYLREVQADAIAKWLRTVPMPALSLKMLKNLQKEFQHEFDQRVSYKLGQLLEKEATARADELFKEITHSSHIGKYLAAMKLITPKEKHAS